MHRFGVCGRENGMLGCEYLEFETPKGPPSNDAREGVRSVTLNLRKVVLLQTIGQNISGQYKPWSRVESQEECVGRGQEENKGTMWITPTYESGGGNIFHHSDVWKKERP